MPTAFGTVPSFLTILPSVGPVALFGLLFLVYRFALSGIGDNFLRTVAF